LHIWLLVALPFRRNGTLKLKRSEILQGSEVLQGWLLVVGYRFLVIGYWILVARLRDWI
jgi:hypothetical protein